jgi:PAS domain S-box-containing protein
VQQDLRRAERIAEAMGVLFVETRVPVIVVQPEGRFVAANAAAIAQYGYTLDELLTMRIQDLQAHTRAIEGDLQRAASGDPEPLDRRPHRRKDGSILWVVPTAGPVVVDGETLVASVLKDVTDLIDAEYLARDATEANLRDQQLVLDAAMAMLGERELAPALQVLARAFAEGVGRATTVWLPASEGSRNLRCVASYDLRERTPSQLEELRLELDQEHFARLAWETGAGYVVDGARTTPGSIEHKVMEGVRESVVVAPMTGRSGAHGLLYAAARDGDDPRRTLALATMLGTFGGMILEAVQLEARAQIMWQSASERLTDGIALLDGSRRIVRVNSAERALLGKTDAEIVGRLCEELFTTCRGVERCPHVVAMEERRRVVQELRGSLTGKPLRSEVIPALSNSSGIATIHVTRDLTEERAIRSQLVTTDRLASIGRLAAGVAHEINNPAAFVTVNLGVLRDRFLAGTARTQDVLAMIDESLNGMERIREIVRDLKGFAREKSVDLVDLGAVAQSAIRMAAHETRGRARVERVAEEGAVARVRGARIAQVVLNLVVNAAQAIAAGNPSENRIVVRTLRAGEKVRVEVSDTGAGVDPALADRIFEPFFTTRERTGGTGLGLWLARGIVEEEGGTLAFHNQPDGGACFVVELPAASPDGGGELRTPSRESLRLRTG